MVSTRRLLGFGVCVALAPLLAFESSSFAQGKKPDLAGPSDTTKPSSAAATAGPTSTNTDDKAGASTTTAAESSSPPAKPISASRNPAPRTEPRSELELDVTETSIAAQRFLAREGQNAKDSGYGSWLNRVNAALRFREWTAGLRLDSSLYWARPVDQSVFQNSSASVRDGLALDNRSRFRDGIFPAKLFVNYKKGNIDLTAGDAYAQFGRGFILSMRKVDDLGLDNTVRGGRAQLNYEPISAVVVAGFANPSRVDEATGRALFPTAAATPQPLYGSDRIFGAEIQVGKGGWPLLFGARGAHINRCAPYAYGPAGPRMNIGDDPAHVLFGSCVPTDVSTWLGSLSSGPTSNASNINQAGMSIEVPNLWGHGKLYVEGAFQHRVHEDAAQNAHPYGNALYSALSFDVGRVTNTIEFKSYRNYYPVSGAVVATSAAEFTNVAYAVLPTAEIVTQDAQYGFFNACVNGGRARSDVRINEQLIVYGQGIYSRTETEQPGGACDEMGRTVSILPAHDVTNIVTDGLLGVEWTSEDALSHIFLSGGMRDDTKANGAHYYSEGHGEWVVSQHLSGVYSIEATGRARFRKHEGENVDAAFTEQVWREGENYMALKIAPKWVFGPGIEWTTKRGQPTYYFNGSALYRFRSDSSLRVFVGSQRAGLRCVSGICKVFPAFEGARAELTLRF